MPSQALMAVSVRNRTDGEYRTSIGAVPTRLQEVLIRVQCTSEDPTDPWRGFQFPFCRANQLIEVGIEWSWDKGKTYAQAGSAIYTGKPEGHWGMGRNGLVVMVPMAGIGIARQGGVFPNTYRMLERVTNGPVSYGLSVTLVTR